MSFTNTQTLSIVCDKQNKTIDNQYKLAFGNAASRSVSAVTLKSCTFKNVFYNVIGTGKLKNNILYTRMQGVDIEFTVPVEGFYNITELLTILSDEISAFFLLYAQPLVLEQLTYSSITGKITIEVSDGAGSGNIFELRGLDRPYSINYLIGNTINLSVSNTPLPKQLDSLVSLTGPTCVNLICEPISKSSGSYISSASPDGSINNSIRTIAVNQPFGATIEYIAYDTDAEQINYQPSINLSDLVFSIADVKTNTTLDLSASQICIELILFF
jgi:hypothetical protein